MNQHPLFNKAQSQQVTEVVESKTEIPELTVEARVLLKEASQDLHGSIMYIRHLNGTNVQTNGKNFVGSGDRREIAKWEHALEDLRTKGLVVARGAKGEMNELTNLGFQIADMIEL